MKRGTKNCCKCCPNNEFVEHDIETTEELLELMNVYYTELAHRDTLFWKQVYTYFYACLIVMLIPFASFIDIDFGNSLPKLVFPIFGMVLSLLFHIVSRGYVVRLVAIGNTYSNLINMLPAEYRRVSVNSLDSHKLINVRIASFVTWIMFVALLIIGAILIGISIMS